MKGSKVAITVLLGILLIAGIACTPTPTPTPTYNLTINIIGGIDGCNVSTNTSNPHNSGSVVLVTAHYPANQTSPSAFIFGYWSGNLTGSNNPTTITMDSDKTINATFSYCVTEVRMMRRGLPESSCAGDTITVDLTGYSGGSFAIIAQVQETVPAGWIVLSPAWTNKTGDTYTWINTNSYQVQVPVEAAPGTYTFTGQATSQHWCPGYVTRNITGDQTIEITATPTP